MIFLVFILFFIIESEYVIVNILHLLSRDLDGGHAPPTDLSLELGVGELCHTPEFDLYDSIAALELMDPKMVSQVHDGTPTLIESR